MDFNQLQSKSIRKQISRGNYKLLQRGNSSFIISLSKNKQYSNIDSTSSTFQGINQQNNPPFYPNARMPQSIESDQQLITRSDESPSHSLEKEERNFCIPSESDHFQIGTSIKNEFQRYDDKQDKPVRQAGQAKKQTVSNKDSANRSLSKPHSANECYKDWKIYRNKSDLNMLPFPYCMDQSFQYKKLPFSPLSLLNPFKTQPKQKPEQQPQRLPKLYKLKIQNRVRVYNENQKQNKVYRPYFNYEKTPINEYLNYDLTQEINTGLRDVQIMAEEIRRMKKAKKVANDNVIAEKEKHTKGLRIRRSYVKNHKGLFKNEA